MSDDATAYELRVTGPAQRQLGRLPEGTAAAIVEFMLTALVQSIDQRSNLYRSL